jgi:Arm DNA-binding domain
MGVRWEWSEKMQLTELQIKKAKPTSQPYKLADGRGLFLLVKPTGSKMWRWKYRFEQKES